jgi:PAS domain S-box-containing protein
MNKTRYRKVVLLYASAGITWIVGSDWLVGHFIGDGEMPFDISVIKGMAFVLVMSLLLYALLMRLHRAETKAQVVDDAAQLFLLKMPDFFESIPFVTYAVEVGDRHIEPLWVSSNIKRVLGYSASQVLTPDWWNENLHPEDRLRAINESAVIFKKGGGNHFYRIRHADGNYLYIHDEIKAVDTNTPRRFVGIWHDVSVEERAQQQVREYSTRLERAFLGAVKCIASMVELRDPYTAGHENRVGDLSVAIAAEMGLDLDTQYGLKIAGLVHDIGKISIPSEYLTKPTRLTQSEYQILQTHPDNGYQILKSVDFPWPIAEVAHQHHERINGSGYPMGLKGDQILLEARIVAVADVIESMATSRPYRHALGIEKALAEIESNAGRLYDTNVARAALTLFREKNYQLPTKS